MSIKRMLVHLVVVLLPLLISIESSPLAEGQCKAAFDKLYEKDQNAINVVLQYGSDFCKERGQAELPKNIATCKESFDSGSTNMGLDCLIKLHAELSEWILACAPRTLYLVIVPLQLPWMELENVIC